MDNGWHIIKGYNVYVEDGYIVRGVRRYDLSYCTVYPYIPSKYGGWDNASKELTVSAFRSRLARGTVIMR